MPRKGWKPKNRKKGYRRFLCAPRKNCHKNKQVKGGNYDNSNNVEQSGFCGFDVPSMAQSITVLSLFDGLGAAKVALDSLKIKIKKYISSEIDEKAICVLKYHYFNQMEMVGCVRSLTEEKLSQFGNVHLLLAGSPCNDFTLCNPARLNMNGKGGELFFEFKRILDFLTVSAKNNGHSFYWLYENTFSMEKSTLNEISRNLSCQPVVICASALMPMKRKRYFWGTVPELYAVEESSENQDIHLQDFIKPYRTANLKVLPTLTTSSNSQMKGKNFPVTEDCKDGYLYINEIELVFGYPDHYTDVNLSITDRRRLLGRSWCVPTIAKILEPLAQMLENGECKI